MGDSIERANDATVKTDGGEETSNRLLAAASDSSTVKPAGQSGNRLLSMSTGTGTSFSETSQPVPFDTVKRSLAGEATHSFFYSLAQRPVTGVSQFIDHTVGAPFHSDLAASTKFMDAPKPTVFGSAEWHAQTVGGTAGMLPWFVAAFKVSKGALGGYRTTAAEMTALGSKSLLYRPSTVAIAEGATAGFLHDAILSPTDPSEGNFFAARAKHGLVGAATFGTLTAATIGLKAFGAAAGETTLVGRAMENRILNPALAGVPAALASEAAGVVVLGHDPSLESLGKTTYTMVLVGGGLGAFHSVPGRAPEKAAEPGASAETRTGPEILSGKIEAARLEVEPAEKSTAGDRRIATPETALAGTETAAEPIKFNVTGDPAVVETFQRGANSAIRAVQEPTEANVATFKEFAAGEGKSMGTIMLEMANQLDSKAFIDLVKDSYKIDEPTALTVRGQALAKLAADPQSQQPSRTAPFFDYARNEGADKGPELLRYAQETGNKRLEIVVKEAYLLKEGKSAPRSSEPVSLKLTEEQAQRFAGFVNLVKDLPMESANYAQFRYNLFTWMNNNPDLVPSVIDYAARHPASQIAGPVDYYAPEHSNSLGRFPTIEGVKAPEPGLIDSDPNSVPSDFARPLHPMEGRGDLVYSKGGHRVYDYANSAAEFKVLETKDGGQIFYYQTGGEKPSYATLIYMPDGRVGHRFAESSETQFYEKSADGTSQLRQREGLDPDIVDWMTRAEAEAGVKSTASSLSIPDGKTASVEPVDNTGRTGNDTAGAGDATSSLSKGRRLWQLFANDQTPGHARQLTENFGDLSPAEFKQWLDYVTHRPEGLPAEAPPPNLAKLWVPSAKVLARDPIVEASEASPDGKGPLESYHRFLSRPAKSIPDFPDWLADYVRERFKEAEATAPDGAKPHEILDLALPRQLSRYIRSNYMDINTTQPVAKPASDTLPADIRAKFEEANLSDTRNNPVGRPPREEGNTVVDRMDRLNELLDIQDATIRNRLIDLGGQDHPKLKNITSKLNPETAAPEYAELLKIMLPGAKNISDVTTVLDAIFNANKTRRNSPNSPEVAANEQLAMAALEGMVPDPTAMGRAQQIVHDMIVGKIRDPRPGGDFGGRGGPGGGRGGNPRDQRGGPRNRDRGDGGLGKQEKIAKPPAAEETQNQGDADAGQTNLSAKIVDPPEKVVKPPVFEGSKNVGGGEETLVGPGKQVEASPMTDMFDWSRPPQTDMERLLREAFLKRTKGKGKERGEDRDFEEEGDGRGKKNKNQGSGSKRRGGARNLTRDYLEGDMDGEGD